MRGIVCGENMEAAAMEVENRLNWMSGCCGTFLFFLCGNAVRMAV